MLEKQDQVDEIPDAGVLAVTEVAEHGVELLGGVAIDVDDLDDGAADSGEVERVRQLNVLGIDELMSAGGDVELDTPEDLPARLAATFTRQVT